MPSHCIFVYKWRIPESAARSWWCSECQSSLWPPIVYLSLGRGYQPQNLGGVPSPSPHRALPVPGGLLHLLAVQGHPAGCCHGHHNARRSGREPQKKKMVFQDAIPIIRSAELIWCEPFKAELWSRITTSYWLTRIFIGILKKYKIQKLKHLVAAPSNKMRRFLLRNTAPTLPEK
jgi:hypothetical protein